MKKLILFLVAASVSSATGVYGADALDQAIKALNAHAKTDAAKKLVLAAASQQTQVPEKTLQSQMATTHLSYGELVVANSLAEGSGKTLANIVASKQGKGWADLSREVKIDPDSVVDRLRTTEKMVQMSQAKSKQAGNAKKPNNASPTAPPLQSQPRTAPRRMGGY